MSKTLPLNCLVFVQPKKSPDMFEKLLTGTLSLNPNKRTETMQLLFEVICIKSILYMPWCVHMVIVSGLEVIGISVHIGCIFLDQNKIEHIL